MSGHAGFQPIGVQPPSVSLPQVGGMEGTGSRPPTATVPEAVPDGVEEVASPVTARAISQRLDSILLVAAKCTTRAVDVKSLRDATAKTVLDKNTRSALLTAALKAKNAMDALSGFTGREIAAALVADENGCFNWNAGNAVAEALRLAIDTQADLSEMLHTIVNRKDVTGDLFETLSEMALQCDRRQSEISTLAMQLADAVTHAGDDPTLASRLDARLSSLLPRQALSMHGTGEALEKIKAQLEPLAARLEAFAARPNASLSSEEFMAYTVEVKTAAAALKRIATEGFPTPDGGRLIPDRDILSGAAQLVRFAEQKLEDTRRGIGERLLRNFANQTFGFPDNIPLVDRKNLQELSSVAPHLARAVALRYNLHKAALAYMKDPSEERALAMTMIVSSLSRMDRSAINNDITRLYNMSPHGPDDMSEADWNDLRATFRKPRAIGTQVAHFVQMVDNVSNTLTPEQFLSTSSAQELVKGHLAFSTIVEARIHGMSDADVDPALDDSRLVTSTTLGSGHANTVFLVSYTDGSEYVFKPEAPGRQGMESLTLSQDYRLEQQVAHLNLATQDVARVLGLTDIVPKCSVGVHNGQYGLFMGKAPGVEGIDFVKGEAASGSLSMSEISKLPPDQQAKVMGEIIRGLNRLEWLDLITGQGDRHAHNYLINISPDLTVTVTGIDNDQCFTAYRTGLHTYVLEGDHADTFRMRCAEVVSKYDTELRDQARSRFHSDPGVTVNGKAGTITLDTTKFQTAELFYASQKAIGMHGAVLPDFIDEELYEHLVSLKSGTVRDTYLAGLAKRLPPDAVASARNRLDEAIAYAEKLKDAEKVVKREDFAKKEVQKRILSRDLTATTNPIKPIEGQQLPNNDPVVKAACRQTRSIFGRDILCSRLVRAYFRED